jgi:hypothetical protein
MRLDTQGSLVRWLSAGGGGAGAARVGPGGSRRVLATIALSVVTRRCKGLGASASCGGGTRKGVGAPTAPFRPRPASLPAAPPRPSSPGRSRGRPALQPERLAHRQGLPGRPLAAARRSPSIAQALRSPKPFDRASPSADPTPQAPNQSPGSLRAHSSPSPSLAPPPAGPAPRSLGPPDLRHAALWRPSQRRLRAGAAGGHALALHGLLRRRLGHFVSGGRGRAGPRGVGGELQQLGLKGGHGGLYVGAVCPVAMGQGDRWGA